jgi:hypothetical protein
MADYTTPPGFSDLQNFTLLGAMLGRRPRRFSMGAGIPDGVFHHKSKAPPRALSDRTPIAESLLCSGVPLFILICFHLERIYG